MSKVSDLFAEIHTFFHSLIFTLFWFYERVIKGHLRIKIAFSKNIIKSFFSHDIYFSEFSTLRAIFLKPLKNKIFDFWLRIFRELLDRFPNRDKFLNQWTNSFHKYPKDRVRVKVHFQLSDWSKKILNFFSENF